LKENLSGKQQLVEMKSFVFGKISTYLTIFKDAEAAKPKHFIKLYLLPNLELTVENLESSMQLSLTGKGLIFYDIDRDLCSIDNDMTEKQDESDLLDRVF
jgi:hypothetical protein